ncbi:YaaL family protein [Aureibacillus halotolerans]|uniref:Uncharacterized protein DUF2508 n=1 Tax=Aureibacillus halotolerans TaxID=1508390 RepID=A0A4R6TY75_9BACI|nr:YaaL family protein [Aureibacillus halotolerans]TDQ38266.1 uncharacterized protein DUF2508 [Aureibacillus halotolerans]
MRGIKKKRLKRQYDQTLLDTLDRVKAKWEAQERIARDSVDLPRHFDAERQLEKAVYFFLLKEARYRSIKRA